MRFTAAAYQTICWLLLFTVCTFPAAFAQTKIIRGVVQDAHSNEAVPFASVSFLRSGKGTLTDSSGTFEFRLSGLTPDTLLVTNVGYQDYKMFIALPAADTLRLSIKMDPGRANIGVVVKAKGNRGLMMWRRIVKRKPFNNRYRFANFSYELYNKLELDLNNIKKERLANVKLFRPFNFILNNIDTSEGTPFLPVYVTEAISDYYYQASPVRRREVFKAVKTIGVDNQSVAKMLGGMDQVVNVYSNFIPVFDKEFVSPISDNGDEYYNYKVADTQYVSGRRIIHFLFEPRRKGTNTFEGDCWVHDTTYAIQKMTLRLSREANINYVGRLSLIQEYGLINDSTWFLAKDKFVVDIAPLGKSSPSFIGRKTTTYRNVLVNHPAVEAELAKNKAHEEVVLPTEATAKGEEFWAGSRHEPLSKNEQSVYTMIDTLMKMPQFQRYTRAINFLGTGYTSVGKFDVGPWQNWVYFNEQEGTRLRFDIGTNSKFSKKVIFNTYLAYGFGDGKLKGGLNGMYLFKKEPRMYLYAGYKTDYDYAQKLFDEVSSDNVFALAIRKNGVPIKYIKLEKAEVEWFKEWKPGFSVLLSANRLRYNPVQNLPGKELFATASGEVFNSFETGVRLRFAYLEKFLESHFYRYSLGSPLPIVELRYTRGLSGVLRSAYDYHKLFASVSDYMKVPPLGNLYFNFFGGKTFGTLPYVFLDVAPGNEIYYYNKYVFNMMNRYEYVNDRYAGFNLEHNIGNGLFRFIPLTRKLKFRQLWTAKGLWGELSNENKALNFTNGYPFQSLDGKMYMEVGTGVDNIFKVLRLDFIWRVLPEKSVKESEQRFGVFGSFRLAF